MSRALLVGYLADQAVGDPRRWHPVAGFGAAATALESRWYADNRAAGALCTAVLVALPTAATVLLQRRLGARGRTALLATATWVAVGGRSLSEEARAVAAHLADGALPEARRRVTALVGRDPSEMNDGDLSRAVIESLAENTADAVVATLLLGAVAGPAGVVAHRCTNTLDAMFGHRGARYGRFGTVAARLDDLLAFAPARATVLLACVLAPLVGGSPRSACAVVRRDGRKHPSPNAGPCEAAFAGALGLRLGGENAYGGRVELRGPQGEGPPAVPGDIARAVRLANAIGATAAVLVAACARRPRTASRRCGCARLAFRPDPRPHRCASRRAAGGRG